MISYLKRRIKDESIFELHSFSIGSWIKVVNPTVDEINFLCRKFGLDKQNLISGLDENEVPRIEFENNKTYIFLKDIEEEKMITFLLVIGKGFILTLSKHELDFFNQIKMKIVTTQRIKMILKILAALNKKFEARTLEIVKKVKSSEKKFGFLKERDISKLLEYESILDSFVFYYSHLLVIYNRMIKRINFYEKDKEIVEDLIIEANESFNLAKTSLKTISNIRNHYMILLSNKLNRVITILTIVTIFISIPAAISGIYGMNIRLPFQSNPFAFYYIILVIVIMWVGFILYLKKELF